MLRKSILIGMCLVLMVGLSACGNSKVDEVESMQPSAEPSSMEESSEVDTSESTYEPTHTDICDTFVAEFNEQSEEDFEFVEEFAVQDKESGHYRTEFRLNGFSDALGRSYSYGDSTVDLIIAKSYFGDFDIRIYSDNVSFDQALNIVKLASPIMDPEVTDEELSEAVDELNERKTANGLYFGKLGMTLFGTDPKGYEIMLKKE